MKTIQRCSLILGLLVACLANARGAEKRAKTIDMFEAFGTPNQTVKWVAFSEDPSKTLTDVWQIQDGVIICRGTPRGYIRTAKDFTNFVLTLEWRRPEGKEPGPGGVLIRMTGKDKIWPKSLEAQLNAGGAGDFWGLIGYRLTGPANRMKMIEHEQFGTLRNVAKTEDVEKPVGQWNTYRIVAEGDTVTLSINGRQVNQATGCDVVPGKICLTSEGQEIHFRNVRLEVALDK